MPTRKPATSRKPSSRQTASEVAQHYWTGVQVLERLRAAKSTEVYEFQGYRIAIRGQSSNISLQGDLLFKSDANLSLDVLRAWVVDRICADCVRGLKEVLRKKEPTRVHTRKRAA